MTLRKPIFIWLILCGLAGAQTGPPRVFFSDLESGPSTGGENDRGAFVTLWGRNFGAARGASTVTVGGGAVAGYPVWTDTRIALQLGPAARTGEIVVRTSAGASNGVPFTVRAGDIYFVAATGSDSNAGGFANPWRTLAKAAESMKPGDSTYVRDGFVETREDIFGAALSVVSGGTPGRPLTLAAYPGATVTVGSPNLEFGLRIPNIEEADVADHWVISQLTLRGLVSALAVEGPGPVDWRVVGNNISCPNADGQTGCFVASLARQLKFYGNEVHHTARRGASKQYHAVYFTTDSNQVEAAWNFIHDNNSCRAMQFHSSPLEGNTGLNQYDLSVHDNLIRGEVCDGINFATVDPSRGKVEAYNNVIVRAGAGPHPEDDSANYSCVYVAGSTNQGPDGSGTVEIYNNTCYDFGGVDPGGSDSGAFVRGPGSPRLFMNLRNNIAYALRGQQYVNGALGLIRGSNNLWFGAGSGPAATQGNVNADPRFVSPANFDFRLQAGSPAIDAGLALNLVSDFDGVPRPQGPALDLGAFEFFQGPAPAPVTGPRVTRVADAFSFDAGPLAPGKLFSIFGAGLGPADGIATNFDAATRRLPSSAGGVSVAIDGRNIPLLFVRADQINAQAPYELAGTAPASVVVSSGGQSSPPFEVSLDATQPGLFPQGFHPDFSLVTESNPARAEGVVIFFATGQGATRPAADSGAPAPASPLALPIAEVGMDIGGRAARVDFAGLTPGTAGVMQVHVVVPAGIAAPAPVVLRVGTRRSQSVTLPVR